MTWLIGNADDCIGQVSAEVDQGRLEDQAGDVAGPLLRIN